MPLSGSCLCGRVRLTVPTSTLELCHCTDCRQYTGALTGAFLLATPAVEGAEHVASFAKRADSGATLTRHWCKVCGSNLYDTTSSGGAAVCAGKPPGTRD